MPAAPCGIKVPSFDAKPVEAAMRLMRPGTLLALALFGVAGGPTPAWAISDAQRAYDACTKHYNSTFRSLPGHRAIVAGLSSSGSQCFWRYNSTSEADAIDGAMSNCRRAMPRCFLYNSDGTNTGVARISNMGGSDGTRTSSSSGSGVLKNLLDIATAVVGGVSAAGGGGGGGARIPTPSGYSQKGAFDDCEKVYRAAGQTALADACKRRSSNMGPLR